MSKRFNAREEADKLGPSLSGRMRALASELKEEDMRERAAILMALADDAEDAAYARRMFIDAVDSTSFRYTRPLTDPRSSLYESFEKLRQVKR